MFFLLPITITENMNSFSVLVCLALETEITHKLFFVPKYLYFLFFNNKFPLGFSNKDFTCSSFCFSASFLSHHRFIPSSTSALRYTALL